MTSPPPQYEPAPQLRRHRRNKVVAGVCGGLGRHFDLDPVIFRVVLGVLTVTGGLGLIFYGFAWLLLPLDGEDESEGHRLLTGRVEGASMAAVLAALVGCGLFLSMLHYVSVLVFSALLALAAGGSAVWSQRRRLVPPEETAPDGGQPAGPARASAQKVAAQRVTAQTVADAPPETQAPPSPGSPSWWRDPIIKDGTTGPVGPGYLWGPADAVVDRPAPSRGPAWPPAAIRGPRGIGGRVFLLALCAAGLGAGLSWHAQPVGSSLQIGLACALAVFGLGMLVSAFVGRTGVGTIILAVLTTALLAVSASLPKNITSDWVRTDWRPASVSALQPKYEVGSGVGTLNLRDLALPAGASAGTRAEVGAGRLVVVVPKNVTVRLRVDVGIGDIQLPGEDGNDVDIQPDQKKTVTLDPPPGGKAAGTLDLRMEVGVGQAEVTRAR
ncbi:PspC domain-containing protein [Streptomyces sp. NPDC051322]|uniref:PspC domain-containing protein n=1 Tax=Streptomyces sp. NPDC051322 TaxID=3154645 RepID=UPI00344BB399